MKFPIRQDVSHSCSNFIPTPPPLTPPHARICCFPLRRFAVVDAGPAPWGKFIPSPLSFKPPLSVLACQIIFPPRPSDSVLLPSRRFFLHVLRSDNSNLESSYFQLTFLPLCFYPLLLSPHFGRGDQRLAGFFSTFGSCSIPFRPPTPCTVGAFSFFL